MTPNMRDAGFKGGGRSSLTFKRAAADDDLHLVVQVRGYTPMPIISFHLDWWVTTRSYRDYARTRGFKWTPDARENAVYSARERPPDSLVGTEHPSSTWDVLDPGNMQADFARRLPTMENPTPADPGDRIDAYGPVFRDHLAANLIPK